MVLDDNAAHALDTEAGQPFVHQIKAAYPDLPIHAARLLPTLGQFNTIVIVNEALVFRFPRSPHVATTLAAETELLRQLHGRLPLPVPEPLYQAADPRTGALQFMGYPLLPGQPLWRDAFDTITDDQTLDHLAAQLAGFLQALHTLPLDALEPQLPVFDTAAAWTTMLEQFQRHLYPHMRPDARTTMTQHFTALLDDLRQHPTQPTLRHGDFGTGNILHDPQRVAITGIIDFGMSGIGDPTVDVAALAASYGEAFVERCCAYYPAVETMLPRARLYQGTFALQQALYALRDGNQDDFEDGLAEYV